MVLRLQSDCRTVGGVRVRKRFTPAYAACLAHSTKSFKKCTQLRAARSCAVRCRMIASKKNITSSRRL